MKLYSIIPARGGSKKVPKKNIKNLGGFPLIAYSICASNLTKGIDRTIVSTDSKEIANIALKYGAEVPFIRPSKISQDNSTDLELFEHVINWLKTNEDEVPDLLVHLRPTTPLRSSTIMDKSISEIKNKSDSTSLRSVHELSEPPQKMMQLDKSGFLRGFFPNDKRPEYYNLPRQVFPKAYHPNGYIDIIKADFIQDKGSLHGPNILGFITPFSIEVDLPEDFEYLEYYLNKNGNQIHDYLINNF